MHFYFLSLLSRELLFFLLLGAFASDADFRILENSFC